MVQTKNTDDAFIMLPTVDFCFKELMQNEKVRRGILAALLGRKPEDIARTELLSTPTRRNYADDKLGILDVRVIMADGTQINFEMQVSKFAFWTLSIFRRTGGFITKFHFAIRKRAERTAICWKSMS